MANYTITGNARGGRYPVQETSSGTRGTVPKPAITGPYFDVDTINIPTESHGEARRDGNSWLLNQTVTLDDGWTTDMGTNEVPGTIEYTADRMRECGLLRWNPQHDPTKPKKVQLGGGYEATYKGDGPVSQEGGTGSFECESRTWRLPEITQGRHAFVRAKADHDWEQRTPFPPKAQHTPNPQYVGATVVFLNRDPALEPYFGRPDARRQPDGSYLEKSSRFTWLTSTWSEGDLELRERESGGVADGESASWGTAEVTWSDDVPDRSGATVDADKAAVGVAQRLRITVPNVYTQMTLGQAVSNQDSDGYNYPGFGVQTNGHVFISAGTSNGSGANDAPKHYMVLQAQDGMTALSPAGSVFVAGGGGVNVASGGGLTMGGEQGVVIAGGNFWGILANAQNDFSSRQTATSSPSAPSWAAVQGQVVSGIAAMCALTDVAVGLKGAQLQHKRKSVLGLTKEAYSGWGGASGFGKLGIVMSAAGALGGVLGAFGASWPKGTIGAATAGTTIFGQSGVIIQSAVTMGLYSLGGTSIGTKDSIAVIASKGINLDAGTEAVLSGKTVTVLADETVSLYGKDDVVLASRKKKASLLGKEVRIGCDKADEGTTQELTASVDVFGTAISVTASGAATFSGGTSAKLSSETQVHVDAPKVLIAGGEELHLSSPKMASLVSDKKVAIGVSSSTILITPSQLCLGIGPALPDAPPDKLTKRGNKETHGQYKKRVREHEAKLKSYAKKVAAAKAANDVRLVFKSGKIEMQVSGMKISLDGSKVKSGGLQWMS